MWKNCLVRKRRWFITILEVLLPIYITISIIILQQSQLNQQFNNVTIYYPICTEEELYSTYLDSNMEMYYAPTASYVEELMQNVVSLINLKVVKSFQTEAELNSYFKRVGISKKSVMGVIFELRKDDMVRECNYVLRPYQHDFTYEIDNLFDWESNSPQISGSRAYIEKSVLSIKMAIDSAYLNMMTIGENITINFTLQQFPYPGYPRKESVHRMQTIIPYTIMFSYAILCPIILHKVVREQRTGIKELLKMVGVRPWMLWFGWFLNFFILNLIAIVFIMCFLIVPLGDETHAPFEYSNPVIMLMFHLLYGAAALMFILALSTLSSKPLVVMIVGTFIWIMSFFIPIGLIKFNPNLKWYLRLFLLLLPNAGLLFGYEEIIKCEQKDLGIQWNNMKKYLEETKNVTLGTVFIMLIVDFIFYFVIALYIELIKPGRYGTPKSVLFPCQALYKFTCKSIEEDDSDVQEEEDEEQTENFCRIMEKQDEIPIKIKIRNLVKDYKDITVVNKLSMNVPEGQITVLIGHNGSGKTTILNIISGIVGATSGSVHINGKNIDDDPLGLAIGYCPQNDLLFSNLTILEHFIVFGMFKGLNKVDAEFEANELIFRLGIHLESHNLGVRVNEGTKRKVSLGIALIGNPEMLLLDEPTVGLDPKSRRLVWNLLLSLKGVRTLLITTHSMKEADVLGDQIAIIDHGSLACFGSPNYLKTEFAVGYYLLIDYKPTEKIEQEEEEDVEKEDVSIEEEKQNDDNRVQEIVDLVLTVIPYAVFQYKEKRRLTILLPHDSKPLLGKLFETLEESKGDFGITKIDLDVTNVLEEVILRYERSLSEEVSEEEYTKKEEEILQKCVEPPPTISTGGKRMCLQINGLVYKRMREMRRSWKLYFIGLLLALCTTLLTLHLENKWIETFDNFSNTFYFDLSPYYKSKVYYSVSNNESAFASAIANQYRNITSKQNARVTKTESVSEAILTEGVNNLESLVVAAEFNGTDLDNEKQAVVNALYSNNATHGAAISLNLVVNSVLQTVVGEHHSIVSAIQPFPKFKKTVKQIVFPVVMTFWATLFPLGILLFSSVFLMIPMYEKSLKSKHLQMMSGVHVITYWGIHYVWDFFIYLLVVSFILLTICLYGILHNVPYNGMCEIAALSSILMVYGLCIIPYAYWFTHMRVASEGFLSFIVINLVISFALMYRFVFYDLNQKSSKEVNFFKHLFFLNPQFGLTYAAQQFSRQVDWNYNWEIANTTERLAICSLEKSPCCEPSEKALCAEYRSYFIGHFAIGNIIVIMFCSTFLYVIFLIILESNITRKCWDKTKNEYDNCDLSTISRVRRYDVLWEQRRAETTYKIEKWNYKAIMRSYQIFQNADLLLAQNLQKNYKRKQVVWGISFGIKPGDSLGLIGVNGVGKTTLYRILTNDLPLICGNARIYHNDRLALLSKNKKTYLKKIGYCPQINGVFHTLTGREILRFTAKLYGIRDNLEDVVYKWLTALGLREYADVLSKYYSDGSRRKLCIAIALIGNPLLILLDEPTNSVDIESRRKLRSIIKLLLRKEESPSSLIITSHLMDECERISNKVAIMKPGRFECFGVLSRVQQKYGNGYVIILYLKPYVNYQTSFSQRRQRSTITSIGTIVGDDQEFDNLINDFENAFEGTCTLQEKHRLSLEYRIADDSKTWSELFGKIEEFKSKHSIIKDFIIKRTSLEDAFLTVARS